MAIDDLFECSSSGIDNGAPIPRATGDTLRDSNAEIVHASMSTPLGSALVAVAAELVG